MHVRRLKTIMV